MTTDPRVEAAARVVGVVPRHRTWDDDLAITRRALAAADAADREDGVVRVDTHDEALRNKLGDVITFSGVASGGVADVLAVSILAALREGAEQ